MIKEVFSIYFNDFRNLEERDSQIYAFSDITTTGKELADLLQYTRWLARHLSLVVGGVRKQSLWTPSICLPYCVKVLE